MAAIKKAPRRRNKRPIAGTDGSVEQQPIHGFGCLVQRDEHGRVRSLECGEVVVADSPEAAVARALVDDPPPAEPESGSELGPAPVAGVASRRGGIGTAPAAGAAQPRAHHGPASPDLAAVEGDVEPDDDEAAA